jgi:hypothetical protein
VIDIFVGATPGSNISNAEITAQGNGFSATIRVSAGTFGRARVIPIAPSGLADITLSVRSADRQVTVYADQIPTNSTINIVGSDALRFEGQIYHSHSAPAAGIATCSLKCTPSDPHPMKGPGCRDCDDRGLIFKVCC